MVGLLSNSHKEKYRCEPRGKEYSMTNQPTSDLSLWYRRPAEQWVEALPIGNGRLGAMIFGGVATERLQLNHDTLWSGAPSDWNNRRAKDVLPDLRALTFAGKY